MPCSRHQTLGEPWYLASHRHRTAPCLVSPLKCVCLFVTLWTVARQAPLSMGLSRQEYWSWLPGAPPRDLPNPGFKPMSPTSPALAGDFLITKHHLFVIWSRKTISKTHVFSAAEVLEEMETVTNSPLSSRSWNQVRYWGVYRRLYWRRHRAVSCSPPSIFMEAEMINLIFKVRTTLAHKIRWYWHGSKYRSLGNSSREKNLVKIMPMDFRYRNCIGRHLTTGWFMRILLLTKEDAFKS